MPVEKLTSDTAGAVTEEFHYDHANDTVAVTHTQDDTAVRKYVADRRLEGPRKVAGLGNEIATLPEIVAIKWGAHRGLPNGWYLKAGYDDEMRALIATVSIYNPHGLSM